MADTAPLTPTDAELWQLHMQMPGRHKDPIDFARAVLDKWGQPAHSGEPVYAFRRRGQDDFCTCTFKGYTELSDFPEKFEMRIFYTAPQPSPTAQASPAAGAVAGSDDLSGTLRRLDSKELAAWVDRGMALSENLAMYVQADCTLRESQARDMLRAHLFSAQPAPAAPTSPAKAAESVPVLPDFDTVEQHIYGACRRYITQDMLEPIHNLIRDAIDADRAVRAKEDSVLEDAARLDYLHSTGSTILTREE